VFADLASFVGHNKLRLDKPSAASIVANCRRCRQGCSLPTSAAAAPTAAAVDTPPPLPSTAVAIVANRRCRHSGLFAHQRRQRKQRRQRSAAVAVAAQQATEAATAAAMAAVAAVAEAGSRAVAAAQLRQRRCGSADAAAQRRQ
jgi:type IV secretory pathway VirB10-like protein